MISLLCGRQFFVKIKKIITLICEIISAVNVGWIQIMIPNSKFQKVKERCFYFGFFKKNCLFFLQGPPNGLKRLRNLNLDLCSTFFFIFLDINECNSSINLCPENAFCSNLQGSYICTCESGYTSNANICSGWNIKNESMILIGCLQLKEIGLSIMLGKL